MEGKLKVGDLTVDRCQVLYVVNGFIDGKFYYGDIDKAVYDNCAEKVEYWFQLQFPYLKVGWDSHNPGVLVGDRETSADNVRERTLLKYALVDAKAVPGLSMGNIKPKEAAEVFDSIQPLDVLLKIRKKLDSIGVPQEAPVEAA